MYTHKQHLLLYVHNHQLLMYVQNQHLLLYVINHQLLMYVYNQHLLLYVINHHLLMYVHNQHQLLYVQKPPVTNVCIKSTPITVCTQPPLTNVCIQPTPTLCTQPQNIQNFVRAIWEAIAGLSVPLSIEKLIIIPGETKLPSPATKTACGCHVIYSDRLEVFDQVWDDVNINLNRNTINPVHYSTLVEIFTV